MLLLGVLQSAIAFRRDAASCRRPRLTLPPERSAATAGRAWQAADVLLETLAPGAVGFQCAQRLAEVDPQDVPAIST